MVVTTLNDFNLLAGMMTTNVIRCMLEAEWLYNNYNKFIAQILQRKASVSNIFYKFPPPHTLCMYFSGFANKF
jgi:hypothetical protein